MTGFIPGTKEILFSGDLLSVTTFYIRMISAHSNKKINQTSLKELKK